jgi:hypothetical protein
MDEMVAFMLGEGAHRGYWFSQTPPGEHRYWWRKHLRAAWNRRAEPRCPDGGGEQHSFGNVVCPACKSPLAARWLTFDEVFPHDSQGGVSGLTEQYEEVAKAPWFKQVYEGKSLGDTIPIDDALPAPPEPTHEPVGAATAKLKRALDRESKKLRAKVVDGEDYRHGWLDGISAMRSAVLRAWEE